MLYIVAGPIGNLEDITLRALRILKEVDLILCEDTRVTKKLLNRCQIGTPTLSYHQHSQLRRVQYIVDLLKQGKNLALVCDAGTPGLADPGSKLINHLLNLQNEGQLEKKLSIIPIPGPSALTAAISISGFGTNKFLFLGYPPHKKGREKFFREAANSEYPVIFYESPYRILKSLQQLKEIIKQEKQVMVARELTKIYETIYRGTLAEVILEIKKGVVKGEFVVMADGNHN